MTRKKLFDPVPLPLMVPALGLVLLLGACSDGALSIDGNYFADGVERTEGDGPSAPGRVVSGSASLQVDSPLPGTIIGTPNIPVKGTVTGLDEVFVNGVKVAVTDGTFQHNIAGLSEGPVDVVVTSEKLPELRVPVILDLSAPFISLTSPQRGQFLVRGQQDTIQVAGSVRDASGIESLTINGQSAQVGPDGTFSASLTPTVGTNYIKVEAKDRAGKSTDKIQAAIYGDFAPYERLVDDAITMRLGAEAMSVVGDSLVQGLAGDLLGGDLDLGGSDEFEVRGISYGEIGLDMIPQQGYFDATITIYDLVIEIATQQVILFIPVTVTGDVTCDAVLNTDLYLGLNNQGGIEVSLSNTDVNLQNFDLDLDGLAGIIDGLIEGLVEDVATDALLEVLNGGGLGDLGGGGLEPIAFEILGQTAELELALTALDVDPGGMTFASDSLLRLNPSPQAPPSPGVLWTNNPSPNAGTLDKMVRFSLADDFVNQLLATLWRGGAFNVDLGAALAESDDSALPVDLTVSTFSLLVGNEILEFADRDTPVGLVLRPLLPPVARIQSPERGVMEVTIGDMMLDFTLDKPDGAIPFASVATHLTITIGFSLDDNGELALDMDLNAVTDLAAEPLFDMDDVLMEQIIGTMLSGLTDGLAEGGLDGLLGGGGLFGDGGGGGAGIDSMEVRQDGPGGDFLSFYVDLLVY